MQVTCNITMLQGEFAGDLSGNAEQLAAAVLQVVGGDPTKDICNVVINDSGQAGSYPMMPPPTESTNVTVNSTFATNNSSPPGDKQTRTNAAASADVSAIYVDNDSNEGNDISTQLLPLASGDRVELRGVADGTRYAIFSLSGAPINQGTFVELPVTFVEAGSALTNSSCTITVPTRP